MMRNTPLSHDGAATADDARDAIRSQVNKGQAHTSVDGEVIHALLGLLDQRVAENFPSQVFGNAADFLKCLVNWHRADRHRRVAQNPVARGVDVFAGRQIHHRVCAPTDRPNQFFDFFLDAAGDG